MAIRIWSPHGLRSRAMNKTIEETLAARVTTLLAVVGTVLTAVLHLVFASHAGALWRDEVNSLELATVTTFSEMWKNLDYDSFPALFFLVLRPFAGVPA